MTLLARERNQSSEYRRERVRWQTIAEGIFAALDRLGWARCRLRGRWKVDCKIYMASFARNVLKAVRKLGRSTGTTDPASPNSDIADVGANSQVGMSLSYLYQRGRFAIIGLFIVLPLSCSPNLPTEGFVCRKSAFSTRPLIVVHHRAPSSGSLTSDKSWRKGHFQRNWSAAGAASSAGCSWDRGNPCGSAGEFPGGRTCDCCACRSASNRSTNPRVSATRCRSRSAPP